MGCMSVATALSACCNCSFLTLLDPAYSCCPSECQSLLCRYYYQVGDGTTFSTTYNFTTFADVSQGARLSVVRLGNLCITVLSALPEVAGADVCM